MVVLDTDHLSLLNWGGTEGERILARLRTLPPSNVATTIVSFEEQTRGWLAKMARAKTLDAVVDAYILLKRHLNSFCSIQVISFDHRAAIEFERMRRSKIRVATLDLRIAAIVLSCGATLLTRNMVDFQRVPGLRVEDWTV